MMINIPIIYKLIINLNTNLIFIIYFIINLFYHSPKYFIIISVVVLKNVWVHF